LLELERTTKVWNNSLYF